MENQDLKDRSSEIRNQIAELEAYVKRLKAKEDPSYQNEIDDTENYIRALLKELDN